MLDRRDLLLDKLSALAQVTVTKQPDGTDTVTFGDAAKPLVEGTTVNWPQTLTRSRRRPARRAARPDRPGRRADRPTRRALDDVAATLAETVNALHTSTPFFSGTTAATLAVAVDGRRSPDLLDRQRRAATTWRSRSPALRGGAAEQGYAALVEQVGSDVAERQGRTGQPADHADRDRQPAPERLRRLAR